MARKTIKVDYLARVEGEGALKVVVRDGKVRSAELSIFEPPRFFEAFLRGRDFREAPDITSRICGICPVAYQLSACAAVEDACGVSVPDPIRQLRRLLYCGEWIESHTLHVYLLHAPDFLGYESAVHMARDHPEVVQRGLRLKKAGNALIECIGGRAIHPVNVRVGGFYRAPRQADLDALLVELEWARQAAADTVAWAAALPTPALERDYELVALRGPGEYPLAAGRIVSSAGLDLAAAEYDAHFEEFQVPYSTALHARIRGRAGDGHYLTGPLARFALNYDLLPAPVRTAARTAGIGPDCRNPYRSIVVRSLEVLFACEEALRLIRAYREPAEPAVELPMSLDPGRTGHGCTEAPRGILYHRYRLAADGTIEAARIVPPTSQNQPSIEDDVRAVVIERWQLPRAELRHRCEQTIRNYDPCISCSTHFLDLRVHENEIPERGEIPERAQSAPGKSSSEAP